MHDLVKISRENCYYSMWVIEAESWGSPKLSHCTSLQAQQPQQGQTRQWGEAQEGTLKHNTCYNSDLKQQNAAHYPATVLTETDPKLLMCCCYFHPISSRVCLSQCWTHCPAWCKAVPGFPRLCARPSCHRDKGGKYIKTLFYTPSLQTLNLRAYSCLHYEVYVIKELTGCVLQPS